MKWGKEERRKRKSTSAISSSYASRQMGVVCAGGTVNPIKIKLITKGKYTKRTGKGGGIDTGVGSDSEQGYRWKKKTSEI